MRHRIGNRQSSSLTIFVALSLWGDILIADTTEPAASDGKAQLEEVVVTARKRAESLVDVPIAMSVLSAQDIERKGIQKIDQLSNTVPNVTIAQNPSIAGSLTSWIRGIGQRAVDPLNDTANALSIDGVYIAGVAAAVLDTFDIEQVEVLRGPQGTLQGRNATGGAVNLTSRRPSLVARSLSAQVDYGRYHTWATKVSAETPVIADKLAVKAAVMSTDGDGFIRHIEGGPSKGYQDYTFGRMGVLFEPTDTFNAYLTADYMHDQSSQPPNIPHNGDPAYPRPETQDQVVPIICTVFNDCRNFKRNTYASNWTEGVNTKAYGSGLSMNWDVGPVTVTSVTGYREVKDRANLDIDATSLDIASVQQRKVDSKQFSEEIRVSSRESSADSGTAAGQFDWVFGGYHLDHNFDFLQPISLAALGLPIGPTNPAAEYFQDAKSDALFGNVNYALSERWHVFGGARQQWDEKNFTSLSPPIAEQDRDESNLVFEAGVRQYFTPENMIYLRFAQATRPGGFAGFGVRYESEEVDSYELGSNLELFDRRLVMRTAAFYYKYNQMQRDVTITLPNPPFFAESVKNAANATIWGAEMEATALPTEALRLTGSIGYLNAKYDNYTDIDIATGLPVDNSALRMPFTPKVTASLSGTYTWDGAPLPGFSETLFGLDISYKSNQNVGVSDLPFADQPAYTVANVLVQFADLTDRYRLDLYVNNVTDKYYIVSGEPISILGSYIVPGMPRVWGVRVRVKFGG